MKQKQLHTPVLLISYNRPECTKKVLSVLRGVQPADIYMAWDGWKHKKDRKKCKEVRLLVNSIDWKCRVHTLFHKKNLGSRDGPYTAMKWFFRHEKMGIILEDDIVPNETFFRFCEELLQKYEYDIHVGSISGGNVIASDISISGSYYFSRYSQTWGWATWKRTWKLYDIHMKRWPEMKGKHMVEKMFPNIWTRTYWTWIFNAVYRGEIPSAWDYQWTFMSWLHGLLTIMPTVNMIQNTGIGSKDATHTKYTNWMSSIPVKPMTFPLKHPKGKIINSALDTLLQRRMYVLWKELVMSIYRKLKYTV